MGVVERKFDRTAHWENVYTTKQTTEVSWFEPEPTTSLSLIDQVLPKGGRIIDVGGGASFLVDRLVARGIWEVTVLDIASSAMAHAQARLGENATKVQWICADIRKATQLAKYDIWHDRAVFHFLTEPEDRQAYLVRLNDALVNGGYFVVATFAPDGPQKCSGLPVNRYSVKELEAMLEGRFVLVTHNQVCHITPVQKTQEFTLAVFQKSEPRK